MGLTIHYSGKLQSAIELKSMIDEVRDIAIEKEWNYVVFDEGFENNTFTKEPEVDKLFGIKVTPKNCEPLCFSFLSDGRMCGIINFNVIMITHEIDADIAFSLFTKTQYAGAATHKELIILLDYISKKYLTDFQCIDEGAYWETRDEDLLIDTFKKIEGFTDSFASSLEMIPPNEDENVEDFILRLADSTNNHLNDLDEDLPEISIEDDNKFKRIKIELEHGGFFGAVNTDIPPEVESMFLDNIIQFEAQNKNAKQIAIYEKIGKPSWTKSEDLSPEKVVDELKRFYTLLEEHNIFLEVIYDYENETALLYDFITLEFFAIETMDISIPGMMTNYIYEEFHPNQYEDLKKESSAFWTDYFANNSERFDEFTLGDLLNSEEMIDFRYSFLSFKKIEINVLEVDFSIEKEQATTKVQLNFEAVIDNQSTIIFNCESIMDFIYQRDFWYLQKVELPKSSQ